MTTTSARRAAAVCLLLVVPMLSVLGLGTAASATNASYWVDATAAACSDAGSGTQAAPFCSISAAAKKAIGPGDTVHVAPGQYREQVTVAGSGASGAPITFVGDAPGVVVLGSQALDGAARWTASSTSAWTTPYAPPSAPRQVFLDDARLAAATSATTTTANSWFYDATAKLLYVDIGGANPGDGHSVDAGAQSFGVTMTGRHDVVVSNIDVPSAELRGRPGPVLQRRHPRPGHGRRVGVERHPRRHLHQLAWWCAARPVDHSLSTGIRLTGTTGATVQRQHQPRQRAARDRAGDVAGQHAGRQHDVRQRLAEPERDRQRHRRQHVLTGQRGVRATSATTTRTPASRSTRARTARWWRATSAGPTATTGSTRCRPRTCATSTTPPGATGGTASRSRATRCARRSPTTCWSTTERPPTSTTCTSTPAPSRASPATTTWPGTAPRHRPRRSTAPSTGRSAALAAATSQETHGLAHRPRAAGPGPRRLPAHRRHGRRRLGRRGRRRVHRHGPGGQPARRRPAGRRRRHRHPDVRRPRSTRAAAADGSDGLRPSRGARARPAGRAGAAGHHGHRRRERVERRRRDRDHVVHLRLR